MITKTFQLETLTCPSCVIKINIMLKLTKGIKKSQVLFNASKVRITFDENVVTTQTIRSKLERLGYPVLKTS